MKKGGEKMAKTIFGDYLKKLRLERNFGLREFAKLVDILPSNLCHIESGRHSPPQSKEILEKIAKVLKLKEGGEKWNRLFDLAAAPGEIPADVKRYFEKQRIVEELPLMARTIKNKKMTRKEIEKLIEDIKKL